MVWNKECWEFLLLAPAVDVVVVVRDDWWYLVLPAEKIV